MRELLWITFAALMWFAPAAEANHVIRHDPTYCSGLETIAQQVYLAKQWDVPQGSFEAYVTKVGATGGYRPEVVEAWLGDTRAIWAADDRGIAWVVQCHIEAMQPNPNTI